MRLIEREHPLAVLDEHAERAVEGRGSVVLVAGEAGMGKTALVRAAFERVSVPVLWGMCDSLRTPRPLGPVRDVADDLGSGVGAALGDAAAQHEIFDVVLDAVRARPRVLVVEDLHWGDEASLDLVRFLARRIGTLPLLLVVTYRDSVDADHPLGAVLGDLVSAPAARRLQLAPLSPKGVASLLEGHRLDPTDVHRRTAGNPFFVSQIVAQPESPLPESVRDAVVARTAVLPAGTRRVLELLSCAPEGTSGALLTALEVPPETVEALAVTGLLERSGRGVAFRHEIARSAVLEGIPPGAEVALHTRMIEAWEATGGDVSVLAHHAAAAGDVPRILRYAPAAGAEAARSGSHREAVTCYELALRHVADAAAEAALLESLSTELYLTDRLHDAIAARTRALELHRRLSDPVAVGEAHAAIAGYAWYAGDRATAEDHDKAAITILDEAGDARALGFALANHAYLAAHHGDAAEAVRAGARARAIAEELGDEAVLHGTASTGWAIARLLDGDLDARGELLAASEVGLSHGLDVLATAPTSNLVLLDVEQGRFGDAEDVLVEALRVSEERNVPVCSMWQLGVRARLRLLQGCWADAEDDARTVLAAGDIPLGRLWPHLVLGLLIARRSAPADNPDLDELWRLALRLDDPGKLAPTAAALAEQAWITGRPDPRLGDVRIAGLFDRTFAGRDHAMAPLWRWARRLTVAGVQRLGPARPPVPVPAVAEGQPYERALALWDDGSVADLMAALALLDDLDARPVAAHVRARLRELGATGVPRGPLPATRNNLHGLTGRQLDVLTLLAEGLSNAEIATRLVISPKTADHHVSAVLGRLGVRTRGEAAALARRLGIHV